MIQGFVKHQTLTLSYGTIVADTIDYLTAFFSFATDDWDGLTVWAHFVKGATEYDIALTDDMILESDHLNLSAGTWSVYLHGNAFDGATVTKRITTNAATLTVLASGALGEDPLPAVPASAAEQILAIAQDAGADAQAAAEAAQALAEAARNTAQGHATTATTQAGLASTAKGLAETAQGKAEDAQRASEEAQRLSELAKVDSESARDLAQGYSASAGQYAGAAAGSAGEAKGYRDAAEQHAANAAGSATTADAVLGASVRYDAAQTKTAAEKLQARANLDVYSKAESDVLVDELDAAKYDKVDVDTLLMTTLTTSNYVTVMRAWFAANGAAALEDLTALCDRWYQITRTGWTGGTIFNQPSVSDISTGTKTGNNAGLTCTPSTNAVAGQDDYAGLPLFACVDCNWYLDSAGEPHITAIDGIPSAAPFTRTTAARFVGVLQMAGWCKVLEEANTYSYLYTDQIGAAGYRPLPEAVRMDGTARNWVLHAKYVAGDDLASYAGVAPRPWDMSYLTCRTLYRAHGNQYCGKTSADDAFIKWMVYLKYASLTLDGIIQGCVSYYNNALKPAVAETNVERVIVTTAQGAALVAGSTVCLGSATYGSKSTQCSVVDRKKIKSIEAVTIEGTAYAAVNIENGGVKFNTTTELFLTTMHWYSGSCDAVKGNDGSPYSLTDGKNPSKVQGIEFAVGGYEIIADCILQYSTDGTNNFVKPYVCREAAKLATSITADYTACGYAAVCPAADGWGYIKKLGRDDNRPEIMFPRETGGSSTTFTRDAAYLLAASSGGYEWRALGALAHGAGAAGLSCLHADTGLSNAYWTILSRLSATGNRGEWAA